jgi:signal transduction histidine kinase
MAHTLLNQSQAHYLDLTLFEATPGMRLVFLADPPRFSVIAASKDLCMHIGIEKEQIIGKSVFEAFPLHPADGNATNQSSLKQSLQLTIDQKASNRLKAVRYDVQPPGKEFQKYYWEVENVPVLNESSEVTYIIHTVKDITADIAAINPPARELREVYDRLHESQDRYRVLLDSINQGFAIFEMIFDEDGKAVDYWVVDENAHFEEHTGIKNATGKRIRELLPNVDEHWFQVYGNVALTGETIRFQQNSQPLKRWFDLYAFRMGGADSRQVGVLFTDITQQKMTEMALAEKDVNLRSIIQNAPVAIFIFRGEDMVIETANKMALEMIRRTPVVVGRPLLEAVPELKGSLAYKIFETVFQTGIPQYGQEVLVPLERNGLLEDRYFNFAYTPLLEAGGVVGVIDVATEVTDQVLARKKIEETVASRTRELAEANLALQNSNQELQRSNANLEEFAHAASHDLKEPIRKIRFFTQQLKERLALHLNDKEQWSFSRIENATERMGLLIDDLLLYAHVSHRPVEKEEVDLNRKIRKVLEDLELDIEEKKAVIGIGQLPVVSGFRRQLQQLFQNLISNALKYSKAGVPPQIDIDAAIKQENGKSYHVIHIKDNGIGFPQEYAEKIFQMFTRLHGKDEYSGTGVGLSIVRKVVEHHGGFIRVQSEPNVGTTFSVYFPAE